MSPALLDSHYLATPCTPVRDPNSPPCHNKFFKQISSIAQKSIGTLSLLFDYHRAQYPVMHSRFTAHENNKSIFFTEFLVCLLSIGCLVFQDELPEIKAINVPLKASLPDLLIQNIVNHVSATILNRALMRSLKENQSKTLKDNFVFQVFLVSLQNLLAYKFLKIIFDKHGYSESLEEKYNLCEYFMINSILALSFAFSTNSTDH